MRRSISDLPHHHLSGSQGHGYEPPNFTAI
jgi:hypothetical protein